MTLEEIRALLPTLTLTELRAAWAENRRESRTAFRAFDWHIHRGLMEERAALLIPEFARRGYICADPNQNGRILDQPRKD